MDSGLNAGDNAAEISQHITKLIFSLYNDFDSCHLLIPYFFYLSLLLCGEFTHIQFEPHTPYIPLEARRLNACDVPWQAMQSNGEFYDVEPSGEVVGIGELTGKVEFDGSPLPFGIVDSWNAAVNFSMASCDSSWLNSSKIAKARSNGRY